MAPLLSRLGLGKSTPERERWEGVHARAIAIDAAITELGSISDRGEWSSEQIEALLEDLQHARSNTARELSAVLEAHPELAAAKDREIYRQLLLRQRVALDTAEREGFLGEHAANHVRGAIDALLADDARLPSPEPLGRAESPLS